MHNVYTEEYTDLKCAASRIENQETKSEWTHLITSQMKKENTIKISFNHKKKGENTASSPQVLLICLTFVR